MAATAASKVRENACSSCCHAPVAVVVFADGRAIIEGGTDADWARGVFDRIIGR